jgi:rare lipoprotein A
MMHILSENSLLNVRAISTARRVVSIAIGATVGISMGLTSVQAGQPSSSVLSGFHSIGNLELASPTPIVVPSTDAPMQTKISRPHAHRWYQMGLASWYGGKFQGRQTASGEDFDTNTLTCAHRTLPLGTWVKITNLRNHKWVVVRVNDRGPVPETRIVDLSSAAAHMLGIHKRGVSRVRLDVIDPQQAEEVARLERLRGLRAAQGQAALQAQTENASQ